MRSYRFAIRAIAPVALLAATACAPVSRVSTTAAPQPGLSAERLWSSIAAAEEAFTEAVERNRLEQNRTLLASAFTNVGPDGRIASKHEFLARSGRRAHLRDYRAEDVMVRMEQDGAIALVTGRLTPKAQDGDAEEMEFRRLWALDGTGQWRLMSMQVAPSAVERASVK